ncbi:hypothetical protein A2U01_0098294, partial [Trifolium medium]|nr:hypothetical protein [Trifolium medium]
MSSMDMIMIPGVSLPDDPLGAPCSLLSTDSEGFEHPLTHVIIAEYRVHPQNRFESDSLRCSRSFL